MFKRPSPEDTEDDILQHYQEYEAERAKNPNLKPIATLGFQQPPKKSIFAQNRKAGTYKQTSVETVRRDRTKVDELSKELIGEIDEKMKIDDVLPENVAHAQSTVVLGDVMEKQFVAPKVQSENNSIKLTVFPKEDSSLRDVTPRKGKSIFAQMMAGKESSEKAELAAKIESMECEPTEQRNLNDIYGDTSAIVQDMETAKEVHKQNLTLLSQMREAEILEERQNLLNSIDPVLVALLAKKRQAKAAEVLQRPKKIQKDDIAHPMQTKHINVPSLGDLPKSNPAHELIQRSNAENWLNFDMVEKDKLEWMRDIPELVNKLKPGEKFDARFDWKGVLLPYTIEDITQNSTAEKDERELYLHGAEPNRPGYTLQELFRLARSNVMQQRVTAFGAIAGILNIYNQGFYDHVLDLPISKIFFLLRFGLDDNTPAMLEICCKALAYLFYNETDETLLDFIYDNPGCQWQPTMEAMESGSESDDPTSIENLQKQMKSMQMNRESVSVNVDESEAENKTSMSDFQLAETDLIECFLRANILQRIYFILHSVRPDNSTVSSCLKLLIRLARTSQEVATQIVNNDELLRCLIDNFLPGLERIDTKLPMPSFYNYPQFLCLKLIRVLISQNIGIAIKFTNLQLVDKLQHYLYNREDIKSKLIRVQIESLRILRCLLLLRIDYKTLYRKFLPALRQMLEWHYNHCVYDVGGPQLIRQHAAALLAAITSGAGSIEAQNLFGDLLHDCCCSWFYKATQSGVNEFSQATLLSTCLNALIWFTRQCDIASSRLRNFIGKYLNDFISSKGFKAYINNLSKSSIILHTSNDRRNAHSPLPNVGAILMHDYGPQLLIAQTYPVYMLSAVWHLLELQLERNEKTLFDALLQPAIVEPLVRYLQQLIGGLNRLLATNFYAKVELKFIYQLLCFEGFETYLDKSQLLQLVYKFVCCLTAENIPKIEQLFERVIFNARFIDASAETLQQWRENCLELVYSHYIVVTQRELTLSLPFMQMPILPIDWPYFQLKIMLKNYLDNNVQQQNHSEREILNMTLNFVAKLEQCSGQLQIVTPTEKLMYIMIAFMGPDSQFLAPDIKPLLHEHIMKFYAQCAEHNFEFDAVYADKCKFENLYALFVDHFQAASYGDDLFSSLVLIPAAQKYDNKWRRRLWSEYASVLRFLDCNENMLLGGLNAYLQPVETEVSLLRSYNENLTKNYLRAGTIPYKIAFHHVSHYNVSKMKQAE